MKTGISISRIGWLFRKDLCLNYKKYLLIIGSMFALMVITFVIMALLKEKFRYETVFAFCFIGIMVFQGIFNTTEWHEFTSRGKTVSILTLPVNRSEVFIQKFISCFIIFPILCCLYMWVTLELAEVYNNFIMSQNQRFEILDVSGAPIMHREIPTMHSEIGHLLNYFTPTMIFFVWIFISSAFLWGALRFNKYTFLKTFSFWAIAMFLTWPLAILLRLIITGEYSYEIIPLVAYFNVNEQSSFDIVTVFPNFYFYLSGFISLVLICISYVQFKDKTI